MAVLAGDWLFITTVLLSSLLPVLLPMHGDTPWRLRGMQLGFVLACASYPVIAEDSAQWAALSLPDASAWAAASLFVGALLYSADGRIRPTGQRLAYGGLALMGLALLVQRFNLPLLLYWEALAVECARLAWATPSARRIISVVRVQAPAGNRLMSGIGSSQNHG